VSRRARYGNHRYEREWVGPILVAVATFLGLTALGYTLATSVLASDDVALPAIEDVVASVQNVPPEQSQDLTSPAKELPQAPKRAAVTPVEPKPAQPSAAANVPFREPPPEAAQAATRIKGVSVASGSTQPASNQPSSNDAFAVSVVADPGAGLELFGLEVVQRLTQKGLQAQLVSMDDAGRPDALLVLGRSAEKRPAAWFCDPGPQGGSTLSHLLLDSLATLPQDASGADSAAQGPMTTFPCADVGAGRARVAATLLEVPSGVVARNELRSVAGDDVVAGITRYFSENGASVRSARASTRLVWPAAGPISSYFGPSHPLGIDVAQSKGNIVAAMAGTVVFAGGNPCCSYGIYVVIDSPDGVRTLYGHLSTLAVRRGQKVKQGATLGKVGNTGTSTGPHLHFEVIDRGVRQDPLRYLP
jgi:murein DD-endopeptidase MepM/ murein hydrolase activator NlpD